MKLFKVEDFTGCDTNDDCVWLANEILQKLIDESPVVYGIGVDNYWSNDKNKGMSDLKARLMFIEEIVKEECKHEPSNRRTPAGIKRGQYCKWCGVELQATWSEKK